jgi:hypothetical protein
MILTKFKNLTKNINLLIQIDEQRTGMRSDAFTLNNGIGSSPTGNAK